MQTKFAAAGTRACLSASRQWESSGSRRAGARRRPLGTAGRLNDPMTALESAPLSASMPMEIGWQRTCDCPPNHLNCLTPKEWLKAQVGVWEFNYEGRDVRDKNLHPATYPISLAAR